MSDLEAIICISNVKLAILLKKRPFPSHGKAKKRFPQQKNVTGVAASAIVKMIRRFLHHLRKIIGVFISLSTYIPVNITSQAA